MKYIQSQRRPSIFICVLAFGFLALQPLFPEAFVITVLTKSGYGRETYYIKDYKIQPLTVGEPFTLTELTSGNYLFLAQGDTFQYGRISNAERSALFERGQSTSRVIHNSSTEIMMYNRETVSVIDKRNGTLKKSISLQKYDDYRILVKGDSDFLLMLLWDKRGKTDIAPGSKIVSVNRELKEASFEIKPEYFRDDEEIIGYEVLSCTIRNNPGFTLLKIYRDSSNIVKSQYATYQFDYTQGTAAIIDEGFIPGDYHYAVYSLPKEGIHYPNIISLEKTELQKFPELAESEYEWGKDGEQERLNKEKGMVYVAEVYKVYDTGAFEKTLESFNVYIKQAVLKDDIRSYLGQTKFEPFRAGNLVIADNLLSPPVVLAETPNDKPYWYWQTFQYFVKGNRMFRFDTQHLYYIVESGDVKLNASGFYEYIYPDNDNVLRTMPFIVGGDRIADKTMASGDTASAVFWDDGIKSIRASSVLEENSGGRIVRYDESQLGKTFFSKGERNCVMNSAKLVWAEGKNNDGIGEYLEVEFNRETNHMMVLNGYADFNKPDLFKSNNRVRRARIISESPAFNFTFQFNDDVRFSEIPFPQKTRKVRMIIEDVYKGTKYSDTCISAIFLKQEAGGSINPMYKIFARGTGEYNAKAEEIVGLLGRRHN